MDINRIISFLQTKSVGNVLTLEEISKGCELPIGVVDYWLGKLIQRSVIKKKSGKKYIIKRTTIPNAEIQLAMRQHP